MRMSVESGNRLTDLPNVGKTTAAKLERIGIRTKEDFLNKWGPC